MDQILHMIYWIIYLWELGSEENKIVGWFFPLLQHREAICKEIKNLPQHWLSGVGCQYQAPAEKKPSSESSLLTLTLWAVENRKVKSEFEEMVVANNVNYKWLLPTKFNCNESRCVHREPQRSTQVPEAVSTGKMLSNVVWFIPGVSSSTGGR